MYRWFESRILWGLLLVLAGVIFLLQNLGYLDFGALIWAILLAAGGIVFLSVFISDREQWWALIPGMALLGVAALIFLNELAPGIAEGIGGSIVLGSISLAFLIIFLLNRSNWWAVIPGGVLLTLAFVAGISEVLPGLETGGIFFIGLGLTFSLVALLPTPEGQLTWAWIPAGIMLLMGLFLIAATEEWINYIWPLALILGGGYLLLRVFRTRTG